MPSQFPAAFLGVLVSLTCSAASAVTLDVQTAPEHCGASAALDQSVPAAATDRLPDSQAVHGTRNIAWAWLGSPTTRYNHDALGSAVHAGSLHVLARQASGALVPVSLQLPPARVIEDRVPRLADMNGDGRDEIVVVESDADRGSSLVVYGLQAGAAPGQPKLVERARSPFLGASHRWLNPVGVADFDGDGHPDVAAVTTPHVDGILTLYRYRPPVLEPVATIPGLTNHRFGTVEQQLAAVVHRHGQRPAVIVPGLGLRTLHALRIAGGKWTELLPPVALPAPIQRITPLASGACVLMTRGATGRVTLSE